MTKFSEGWVTSIYKNGEEITPERVGAFLRYTFPATGGSGFFLPIRVRVVHAVRLAGGSIMKITLSEESLQPNFTFQKLVKPPNDPDFTIEDTIVLLAVAVL